MIIPFGGYITPNRVTGFAAELCIAVRAGTIASSCGSASVVPRPRSIVRRGMAILVINMNLNSYRAAAVEPGAGIGAFCVVLILNGVLATMPWIREDQRYLPAAASRDR